MSQAGALGSVDQESMFPLKRVSEVQVCETNGKLSFKVEAGKPESVPLDFWSSSGKCVECQTDSAHWVF